ncbi:MAG: VOC family protein [Acidimicrobiia bacterium]
MIDAVDLDHVAIATTDITTLLDGLVGDLGGALFHGGDGYGFRWVQTRVGTATTGMTIESLVVWQPEVDDFLARFVERHGGGAHHITFKVADIEATLEACVARGLHPVGVRIDDPQWREAFLQPREAHGTVVQLAQTTERWDLPAVLASLPATGPTGTPVWWPEPPAAGDDPATLEHVVLTSPARTAAVAFFTELLGATVEHDDAASTGLVWPGGGRIRLEDGDRARVVRFDATGGSPRTVDLAGVPVVVR